MASSGIVDFDISLPSGRVNVARMRAESGLPLEEILEVTVCEEFPVLGENELAWQLTAEAARAVFTRVDVRPRQVKHVIYAGSGQWDNPGWSPAAKVAHELGVDRAHCFEVINFCNAGMTAMQIAADKLALRPSEYALVLLGDRLSTMVDYHDVNSIPLFNFGDAGAAVLMAGEDYTFTHLGSRMRTDPSWSDYFSGRYRPGGGVVFARGAHRRGLTTAYIDNFTALVDDVLAGLGRTRSDIDYFVINQGDEEIHLKMMEILGLCEEQSVYKYRDLGHMGSPDTLICLRDLLDRGTLKSGDLILMASSAMGFSWGVTAVEYR